MATNDPHIDPTSGAGNAPNTPPPPQPAPAPAPKPAQAPAPATSGGIDPKSILLPKKDVPGHTVQSAQRVNAGILFEQETGATLPHTEAPKPVKPPEQKKEQSKVRALETYQGDIEGLVENKNVSVVSIAAAEATRRAQASEANTQTNSGTPAGPPNPLGGRIVMLAGGLILTTAAVGLVLFLFLRPSPSVSVNEPTASPFILVDDTKGIAIDESRLTHAVLISALQQLNTDITLTLGLVGRLYPTTITTDTDGNSVYTPLGATQFFSLMAPGAPVELARTMEEPYLLGIHVFDGHQAFLILTVDSYEQAFSGMLRWEATMRNDLGVLFVRTPRPRIPEEGIASSTPTTGPINTGFVDAVVENHDARVVKNENGDLLLLWTFLDKNTLLITTNEYTLRELLTRLTNAPVTAPR